MLTIRHIDHVVLRSAQPERLIRFYCDILGCSLEREEAEQGLSQLRAGSALIDIVDTNKPLGKDGGAPPGKEAHNVDHICLRIAPFDANTLLAYLERKGIHHDGVNRRYGAEGYGPSIYLQDPDGNRLELKGPPEANA